MRSIHSTSGTLTNDIEALITKHEPDKIEVDDDNQTLHLSKDSVVIQTVKLERQIVERIMSGAVGWFLSLAQDQHYWEYVE